MNYQELLLSPEWKLKRKEILIRDNLKCCNCQNANLIKGCLVGWLRYKSKNDNGTIFNFYGLNSFDVLIRKVIFIKKNTTIIPFYSPSSDADEDTSNPMFELIKLYKKANNLIGDTFDNRSNSYQHIAYIDQDFEDEKFARILAIRACWSNNQDELPSNFYDEKFKENTYRLKNKVSEDYRWKIVPALHVHHTYYQINLKPWEYPDESLETLCWVCHENLHKNQSVPFLDKNGRQLGTLTPCTRCFGAGWFPQYKHIDEGECFRCRCAKYEELFILTILYPFRSFHFGIFAVTPLTDIFTQIFQQQFNIVIL